MRLQIISLLLAFTTVAWAEDKTFEVKLKEPVALKSLGGPGIEILIGGADISSVKYAIVDYDNKVAKANVNIEEVRAYSTHADVFYTTSTELVPSITIHSIKKESGIRIPETYDKLIPLYSSTDGKYKVYYLDSIKAGIGKHLIKVSY